MGSSIFEYQGGSSIIDAVNAIRSMGDPNAVYQQMYQSNPQFRQFADSVKGKTPEQAFQERGLDYNQFRRFLR